MVKENNANNNQRGSSASAKNPAPEGTITERVGQSKDQVVETSNTGNGSDDQRYSYSGPPEGIQKYLRSKQRNWPKITAIISAIGLAVILGQAVIYYFTLKQVARTANYAGEQANASTTQANVSLRQANVSERAVIATEKQANASVNQADAATTQANVSEHMVKQNERLVSATEKQTSTSQTSVEIARQTLLPEIAFSAQLLAPPTAGQQIDFQLIILNGGGSRALVTANIHAFALAQVPDDCSGGDQFGPVRVLPNKEGFARAKFNATDAQIKAIQDENLFFFVCGKGTQQGFGGKVPLDFCFFWNKGLNLMGQCSDFWFIKKGK